MLRRVLFSVVLAGLFATLSVASVPSSITVQGRLTDASNNPITTAVTFHFRIFDAPSAGSQVWPGAFETQVITPDNQGLWSAEVGRFASLTDAVFADSVRWLEIEANGTFLPRVRLVTGPYAFRVSSVDGASGGTITSKVSIGPGHINSGFDAFVAGSNNTASDIYTVVSGGTENVAGNYGAVVSGGSENVATGHAASVGGGSRDSASGYAARVGGGIDNVASGFTAVVGGGSNNRAGDYASVASGQFNAALGLWSTVCGGRSNLASDTFSVVSGGDNNRAQGICSGVAGGRGNRVVADAPNGFIGGGLGNLIDTEGGRSAAIVGGDSNTASSSHTFAGGGRNNRVGASFCTIIGGTDNVTNTFYSAILGGHFDTAAGQHSIILGGEGNRTAASYTLAAGRRAKALHSGCFVWGDDTDANIASTATDQFLIRAGGGVGIGSNAPEAPLHVSEGSAGVTTAHSNTVAAFERNDHAYLQLLTPDANESGLIFGSPSANVAGAIVYNSGTVPDGLEFRTNTNDFAVAIDVSGDVGIGTVAPAAPLHVLEGSSGGSPNVNSSAVFEGSTTNYISVLSPAVSTRGILFGEPSVSAAGAVIYNGAVTDGLDFRTNNTSRMTLDALGNLTADGDVCADNVLCPSDVRFKKNVESIGNALIDVQRLRGVRYEWEREKFADREFPAGQQVGLIAQEVREVVPQAVIEQSDGYLAVDYSRLVPLLIEGMKEQQRQIDELKTTIQSMTP